MQLTDPKGRMHQVVLQKGATFHTHRGSLSHDDLIGAPEGSVVIAAGGTGYVALRPLLADYTLAMKRGATIVYPKDAAQILAYADIFPGARVLEAGAGSGALSCWLLRAVGSAPSGRLVSFERRPDFAAIAAANVAKYFGETPGWWRLVTGDLSAPAALESLSGTSPADSGDPAGVSFDRVILDMLAPWECLPDAAAVLAPGGLICCYVATTTQLSRVTEDLRAHGGFFEPGRVGDDGARLAPGRARGAAGPPDDRAHRFPGDRAAARPRGDRAAAPPPPGQGRAFRRGRKKYATVRDRNVTLGEQ